VYGEEAAGVWACESADGEGGHPGKVRAEVAIAVRDIQEEGAVGEVVLVYRAKLLEGDETALNFRMPSLPIRTLTSPHPRCFLSILTLERLDLLGTEQSNFIPMTSLPFPGAQHSLRNLSVLPKLPCTAVQRRPDGTKNVEAVFGPIRTTLDRRARKFRENRKIPE
jgi:hypothetical protein